jgi:hypothetical protein
MSSKIMNIHRIVCFVVEPVAASKVVTTAAIAPVAAAAALMLFV